MSEGEANVEIPGVFRYTMRLGILLKVPERLKAGEFEGKTWDLELNNGYTLHWNPHRGPVQGPHGKPLPPLTVLFMLEGKQFAIANMAKAKGADGEDGLSEEGLILVLRTKIGELEIERDHGMSITNVSARLELAKESGQKSDKLIH